MVRTRAASRMAAAVAASSLGQPQRTQARAVARAGSSSTAAAEASNISKAATKGNVQRRRMSKAANAPGARVPQEEVAAEAGESSGQEAGSAGRAKRQRKEVAVPEPALLCFSRTPQQPAVHVGTSGYSYQHWRPCYYAGLPQRLEFDRYAKQFDMVEINSTFYKFPSESTWDSWRQRAAAVRPSFQYVIKAPQLYTHRKRLITDQAFTESWARFWAACRRLRPHLGPILFQLPGNFRTTSGKGNDVTSNIDRLRRLGEVLPADQRFIFEFRDASWHCSEVYDILKQHGWCLAITHLTDAPHNQKLEDGSWIGSLQPGPNPTPEQYPLDCCDWGVYVRFHGSEGQYRGCHGAAEMARWAAWAKQWVAQGRSVWFAFNNDNVPAGHDLPAAISDCQDLALALRRCGVWPREG